MLSNRVSDFTSKAVLTVDIVEFSTRSLEEQVIATQALIELLRKAVPEEVNNPNRRIWSPAGDGGCLTFLDSTPAAIRTAVTLGILVSRYNKYIRREIDCKDVDERIQNDELPKSKEPIRIRTGIHNGPVVKQVDFDERQNIWGMGINIAARVASLAKPNQIVVSEDYYKAADLENLDEYNTTAIGTWWAKHNISLKLYNVYFQDEHDAAGIPAEEVDEWYTPFHRPLQTVISTYAAMLKTEKVAYRALVLAKRIMDLCPDEQACEHSGAKQIVKSISNEGRKHVKKAGQESLRDDFFSELSPDALLYFCHHTQFKSFAAGDVICKQGEDAHSMMLVVSGKINLYLKDEHLNDRLIPEVDIGEGQIIGEMGIFNPAGRKRTATLKASKNSIMLNLDYHALQPKEVTISSKTRKEITRYFGPHFLSSEENSIIEDIREQIWNLYCNRTKENQIRTIPVLSQCLTDDQREELVNNSELLPLNENDNILLTTKDVWDYLTLIVEGSVIIRTTKGTELMFTKGKLNWFGTTRLVLSKSPFDEVLVLPDTHLVRIPWGILDKFCEPKSKNYIEDFRNECLLNAAKIQAQFNPVSGNA